MANKAPLVVIDDNLLRNLSNMAPVVAQFPFLRGLGAIPAQPGQKPGCGGCAARRGAQGANQFQAVKGVIVRLTAQEKQTFKDLLNAHKVRLHVNQNGRPVEYTF